MFISKYEQIAIWIRSSAGAVEGGEERRGGRGGGRDQARDCGDGMQPSVCRKSIAFLFVVDSPINMYKLWLRSKGGIYE